MCAWQIALDVVQDVRGSIAMYLFIIEEAIQTVGMACYLNYKANRLDAVRELAKWILDNIVNPAIDFNNTYGHVAYPLNLAYNVFYQSAKRNMETYLELTRELKLKVAGYPEKNWEIIINGKSYKTPVELMFMTGSTVKLEVFEKQKDEWYFASIEVNGVEMQTDTYTFRITKDTDVTIYYLAKH